MYLLLIQRLALDIVFDILYFPIWWYSSGAVRAFLWCFDLLKAGNLFLAPGVWFKNLFVPMYGQYDWQGRAISFFMRLIQIFFRTLGLWIWFLFCLFLFCLWFAVPVLVVYGMINF